ncbi:MAG: dephospho-CoA kinase [Tuberibacillus sp.]
MLRIGLTGGIASGKSTVSNMIRKRQIPIVDADVCAREVVRPGETAYQQIVETFGRDILFPNGSIDRKKLGQIIFSDEDKRQKLNGIVHPEVRKRMLEKVIECEKVGEKAVVLDIPLLIESRLMDWVDKIIVVYVPREVELARLMKRDHISEEAALLRMNAQMPLEDKKKYADVVIDNSGSLDDTENQLDDVLRDWGLI